MPWVGFIMECIANGEPFSIIGLVATMAHRFPDRLARYDCVKRCVYRLKDSGTIDRAGFDDKGSPAYVLKSASR